MKYKSHITYPNQIILKKTKHWAITLWNNQYYLGRASIEYMDFSKKYLCELTNEEILEMFSLIKGYEMALKKTFNTTNFNWACLMNNQYKKENIGKTELLHIHVWPRYKNIIEFNGKIFKDESFGEHYDIFKEQYVNKNFLITLADRILENYD